MHVAAPSSPATTAESAGERVRAPREGGPTDTTTVAMPGSQVIPTRNIAAIS